MSNSTLLFVIYLIFRHSDYYARYHSSNSIRSLSQYPFKFNYILQFFVWLSLQESFDALGNLFLMLNCGLAVGNLGVIVVYFYYQLNASRETKPTKFCIFLLLFVNSIFCIDIQDIREYTLNQKFCFLGILASIVVLLVIAISSKASFIFFLVLHFVLGFTISFMDVASNCIAAEDVNIHLPTSHKQWSLPSISSFLFFPSLKID